MLPPCSPPPPTARHGHLKPPLLPTGMLVVQRWAPRTTTSAARTGLGTTSCCWCRTSTSPTWSELAASPWLLELKSIASVSCALRALGWLAERLVRCWLKQGCCIVPLGLHSASSLPHGLPCPMLTASPACVFSAPCLQRVGPADGGGGELAREQGGGDEHRGHALRPLHRHRRRQAGALARGFMSGF